MNIKFKLGILSLLFSAVFLGSCIKEDYYDYSSQAAITSISVTSQNGNAKIFPELDSIFIEVANGAELSSIVITDLQLSALASANKVIGDTLDFSQGDVSIEVTSESSESRIWKLAAKELGSEPQLDNSDFDTWYDEGDYLELGMDASSTIWGTSNPGVEVGGIDPNTLQEMNGDGYAIKMITRYTALGAIAKKPIAAGSAFTGYFDKNSLSLSDPQAALFFGTPFTALPSAFSIDYNYIAGDKNIDKNGDEVGYADSCDIYVLLENRSGDSTLRVGTGWLRTGTSADITQLTPTTIDITYGELPAGTPDFMLPQTGEGYAPSGTRPTHIVVVFSSSAHGDTFQGAKNSTLWVDNFVLQY